MASEKFKALVHFMVHECRDNPARLGSVRLNKALWFVDMLAYQANGVSITGERYVKRKNGPVPNAILPTVKELQSEGKIVVQEPEYPYDSRKYISLVPPGTDQLSDAERNVAKFMLDFVCKRTANEVSEMTHEEIWEAAVEGEEIPLFATLASGKGAITDEVRDWANAAVERIESVVAQ